MITSNLARYPRFKECVNVFVSKVIGTAHKQINQDTSLVLGINALILDPLAKISNIYNLSLISKTRKLYKCSCIHCYHR